MADPRFIWWANVLTGGGDYAVDKIDGASLEDLHGLFCITADTLYPMVVDADDGGAEDSPNKIAPDTNAGTKMWELLAIRCAGITVPNTGLHVLDTDASHDLIIKPGDNLAADTTFTITTGGANRTLTLNENLTIGDGTDITITGVTQANTLTLYESLTLGDGYSGTLTYSAASKVLTVEDTTNVNQDLTTDATPTFLSQVLNSGATPSSQLEIKANNAGMFSVLVYGADNTALGFDADYDAAWYARDTEAALIYKSGGNLKIYGDDSLTPGNTFTPTALIDIGLATGDFDIKLHDAATVGLKLGGTLVAVSAAEINYLEGVSSAIQTQLNAKQASDATLTSIALLGTAANKMAYTTDVDTWAEAAITAAGRSMVAAANAAAQLALLSGQAGAEFSLNSQSLTAVGSIVVDNGGTIGQAAGPLVTFNDTSDYLLVTGGKIGIGVTNEIPPQNELYIHGDLAIGTGKKLYLDGRFIYGSAIGNNTYIWEDTTAPDVIKLVAVSDRLHVRHSAPAGVALLPPPTTGNVTLGTLTVPSTINLGFVIAAGTAPTTDVADQISMWVQDIVAGHAALHIENENSTIIKLYQQAHITDAPGDTAANNATTINAILVALETNGLLASA